MQTLNNQQSNRQHGFTLMELMVVVSLVLIILGVGMTNYITQIKRSRDVKRKSDLQQIRAALEMYRADEGRYVDTGNSWIKIMEDGGDFLSTQLESGGYMNDVPVDPIDSGTSFTPYHGTNYHRYNYRSVTFLGGSIYFLTAIMENADSKDESPCTSLDGIGWVPIGVGDETSDYCYGVQNP